MFIAVESDRAAMFEQVAFQCPEVAKGALGGNKPQFHQSAGGVVNEDEQGAGIASILEPSMVRPLDLDQLTEAFPTQSGLMEHATLFARQPDAIFLHPLAHRLSRHFEPVMLCQHLRRQGRTEIRVVLFDQAQSIVALGMMDAIVRRLAARLVPDR